MTAQAQRRTPAPPPGTYLGMPKFQKNAKEQLANEQLRKNLRHATGTIRAKRAARVDVRLAIRSKPHAAASSSRA